MRSSAFAPLTVCFVAALLVACGDAGQSGQDATDLVLDNPLRPIPAAPLGLVIDLTRLPVPPTPERVRLGRWLFFDKRLSADGSLACSRCHQPEFAFSQRTAVATGIGGRTGRRKAPSIINLGVPPQLVNFRRTPQAFLFWDGRAPSLEAQALQPIADVNEMGNSHDAMVTSVGGTRGYAPYFIEAFGDSRVTKERIAHAIADYERTRMSGNSPFDRWRAAIDDDAISEEAKLGYDLFSGKAQCAHCHSLDGRQGGFHNTGIGWNPRTHAFADLGRYAVTRGSELEDWPGTFKSPTLREASRHPPYMHDGSIATLREVVEFYNRGGNRNPDLSVFIRPLHLTPHEIDAIVAFLNSLEGEGWQDEGPRLFPH
jgi:cytochrome c peroxidase